MKIRPIPPIDLARIAVQDAASRRLALQLLNFSWPPISYAPLRKSLFDILNIQPSLVFYSERTQWRAIKEKIGRLSRSDIENKANVQAAKSLYDYAESREIYGRHQDFYPLAVGIGGKIEFWSPAVLGVDNKPTVVFVDPRKSSTLSGQARQFVFSVMHERIRAADPAYEDVQLAILQLSAPKNGPRAVSLRFANELPLFSFEELDCMIRETYKMWLDILSERAKDSRSDSGAGPLFGQAS